MPVESTTTIAGLDINYPNSDDPISQSDDHHRQNKAVLKNIFPGVGGDGFAIPIVAEETELNFLAGVTSLIQTQFDNLTTLIGTKLKKDGSENMTGTLGSSAAAAVDSDYVRAVDFASQTLGGTMKVRYVSGTKTLYLSNDDAIDP